MAEFTVPAGQRLARVRLALELPLRAALPRLELPPPAGPPRVLQPGLRPGPLLRVG